MRRRPRPRREAIRIASIAGVPVSCHEVLVWLLGFLTLYLFAASEDTLAATRLAGSVLLGLLAVLIHEAGHALAARRLGVPVSDILLHVFGGLTRMAPPATARQELLVGAAGPLANLAVAAALWPVCGGGLAGISFDPRAPLEVAFSVNLLLGVLNFVPAFPMDGGRILRASLTPILGPPRATLVALVLGRLLALAMIAAPLALGPEGVGLILPVIGLVLLVLGENEARRSAMREEERRVSSVLALAANRAPAGPASLSGETQEPGGSGGGVSDPGGRGCGAG